MIAITALALMCAFAPKQCSTDDAARVATAIDSATDDPGLRAHLVVYAWHESRWRVRPRAESWDARAGVSCGPWQQRCALRGALTDKARAWLHDVQASSLASVDSSGARAWRRAREAQRLLDAVR